MLALICTDETGSHTEPRAPPLNLNLWRNGRLSYTRAPITRCGGQGPASRCPRPCVGRVSGSASINSTHVSGRHFSRFSPKP